MLSGGVVVPSSFSDVGHARRHLLIASNSMTKKKMNEMSRFKNQYFYESETKTAIPFYFWEK